MCGRVAQYDSWSDLVAIMRWPAGMTDRADAEPRYNVAPSTVVKLLVQDGGTLVLQLVRWGWRPHWATERAAPINARVEKVAHGRYWSAIWPHRALCPISGWYEWVDEGGTKKQPYLSRRRDGKPCLAAAIGQVPHGEREAGEHDGFVIITADAEGGMVDVHDRRPVILSPDLAAEWLDADTPKERAEQMLLHQGEPPDAFEWYRVSTAVGNVRNHGAELVQPI
ncbi:MAG: putative SOS response-associated peptidase YedK [Pseudomonas citronellolis]|nr:MAG: putative SOS response-associated peptidase YedK [Pseudomonas citronellolis]